MRLILIITAMLLCAAPIHGCVEPKENGPTFQPRLQLTMKQKKQPQDFISKCLNIKPYIKINLGAGLNLLLTIK